MKKLLTKITNNDPMQTVGHLRDNNMRVIDYNMLQQDLYGAPPTQRIETQVNIATKITSLLLVAVTLVFGIISFIKIRKTDDKILKKKKIKNTIIIISILVVLIVCILLLPRFLKKYG